LAVDYDDGFVAYINGNEVARRNMPAGVPSNLTFAAGNHEASRGDGASNPQEREFIAVPTNVLVSGSNVIAVTVHNVSAGSSDLSLIVEVFTNITLVRGPFIQIPNSNDVTVVWRTDALTDSAVDYSLDLSYGNTISDPAPTREHVINIAGLIAGTNYNYRIRSGGVTLWQGDAFRTKRADNQAFRVVIIGDFGSGTSGMASVYASKRDGYAGRRSASGERVSSGALTAAHKTLPFGTMVRVTNRRNNKSVVVRIIDRGPFVRGRVIDVTPAGAHALGFSGVAPVSLSVVGRS